MMLSSYQTVVDVFNSYHGSQAPENTSGILPVLYAKSPFRSRNFEDESGQTHFDVGISY